MHAHPPTSFDRYTAYIGSWWNDFDWKPTKKYYVSCHVVGRIGAYQSHWINTRRFFMNEINDSVFREGIRWWILVFQDGDYALTKFESFHANSQRSEGVLRRPFGELVWNDPTDSANLSTCQMVAPFGNYQHRFKTIFCCYFNKSFGN